MNQSAAEPRNPASSQSGDEELQLSPSESFAHNAAVRVAGGRRSTAHKTQRALASIVLGFELFVVFLMGMTVYGLALLEPAELGIWGGLGMCGLIVVALGLMRIGNIGVIIGWVVHLLMLLTAFVLPMAIIVGIIFTALWVYCMVRGARIDRERAAWEQAHAH